MKVQSEEKFVGLLVKFSTEKQRRNRARISIFHKNIKSQLFTTFNTFFFSASFLLVFADDKERDSVLRNRLLSCYLFYIGGKTTPGKEIN